MQELVLVRGLPGSGKSTFAQETFTDHEHYEADMWHVNSDGEYRFDLNEIGRAHEWVQRNTEYWLRQKKDVVVTNTFVKLSNIAYFVDIARRTKSLLTVITLNTQYGSIHNVPEEVIKKMTEEWQVWPFDESIDMTTWPICICSGCGHYETMYDTDDKKLFHCKTCGTKFDY